MEARARAAVAKLQEVSQQVTSGSREAGASPSASDEDAEIISRTLLLAQRTADTTVAEANAEAEADHGQGSGRCHDGDRQRHGRWPTSCSTKPASRPAVRPRPSASRPRTRCRRCSPDATSCSSDVDHLEHYLGAQRERLRDAAVSLQDLVERVPGGLGELRRPLLSASAEPVRTSPRPPDAVDVSRQRRRAAGSRLVNVVRRPRRDGDDGDDLPRWRLRIDADDPRRSHRSPLMRDETSMHAPRSRRRDGDDAEVVGIRRRPVDRRRRTAVNPGVGLCRRGRSVPPVAPVGFQWR